MLLHPCVQKLPNANISLDRIQNRDIYYITTENKDAIFHGLRPAA